MDTYAYLLAEIRIYFLFLSLSLSLFFSLINIISYPYTYKYMYINLFNIIESKCKVVAAGYNPPARQ